MGWANRLSFVSSFSAIQSRDFLRVRLGSVRKRYIRPLAAEDVFHGIRSCGRLSSQKKKTASFTLCLERKQPLLNIFARLSLSLVRTMRDQGRAIDLLLCKSNGVDELEYKRRRKGRSFPPISSRRKADSGYSEGRLFGLLTSRCITRFTSNFISKFHNFATFTAAGFMVYSSSLLIFQY